MTIKCSAGSTDDAQMCFKATDRHEQMKLESREDEEVIFNDATSDNLQQQWEIFSIDYFKVKSHTRVYVCSTKNNEDKHNWIIVGSNKRLHSPEDTQNAEIK